MKSIIIIGLMLTTAILVAGQNPNGKSAKQVKQEQELMRLEREIGAANVRGDKAFFERVEADEFVFTASNGNVTNKEQDLASLDAASETQLVSYIPDEIIVRIYGKTAVVTGRATIRRKNKDREFISQSRFTDVFVKRDGRWQIVAGHSSRIPPPTQ